VAALEPAESAWAQADEQVLSASVRWGNWTLPVWVELGLIAAVGVAMLALAMQQFGRTE
jgi:hypothetical protein